MPVFNPHVAKRKRGRPRRIIMSNDRKFYPVIPVLPKAAPTGL